MSQETELVNNIPVDKIGAVGIFVLFLVAMILFFCYKTYTNSKK